MRLFGRVLAPVERLSEILFGLIMALTVTSAVSVATADHMQIRTMLIAALGCNLAWGIIDAGMYLMARLGERGHNAVVARAIRKAADREQAHRIIADELPPVFASNFSTRTIGRDTRANLPDASISHASGTGGPRLAGRARCFCPRCCSHVSRRHSVCHH